MNLLDYAIQTELDGEVYYNQQALANKDNVLSVVFLRLSRDEHYHAELLKKHKNAESFQLNEKADFITLANVFTDAGDYESRIKSLPDQFDVYNKALEIEKHSISQYQKLSSEAKDMSEKELYTFLIMQEKSHYAFFESLIDFLRHPYEWVESAEFGLRKDY